MRVVRRGSTVSRSDGTFTHSIIGNVFRKRDIVVPIREIVGTVVASVGDIEFPALSTTFVFVEQGDLRLSERWTTFTPRRRRLREASIRGGRERGGTNGISTSTPKHGGSRCVGYLGRLEGNWRRVLDDIVI